VSEIDHRENRSIIEHYNNQANSANMTDVGRVKFSNKLQHHNHKKNQSLNQVVDEDLYNLLEEQMEHPIDV
jgi:hypothetical protein